MQICFCSAEKRRAYCIGTGKYVAYLNILFCLNYYFVFITCFVRVDEQLIVVDGRCNIHFIPDEYGQVYQLMYSLLCAFVFLWGLNIGSRVVTNKNCWIKKPAF